MCASIASQSRDVAPVAMSWAVQNLDSNPGMTGRSCFTALQSRRSCRKARWAPLLQPARGPSFQVSLLHIYTCQAGPYAGMGLEISPPPRSLLVDFLGFSALAGVTKMSSSSSPSEEQGVNDIISRGRFPQKNGNGAACTCLPSRSQS